MNLIPTNDRRAARRLPRTLGVGMIAVLGLAACDTDELLNVEDPEFATPQSLANPSAIPTLIAGAVGDFQIAYSGSGDDALLSSVAVFTDEFYSSDTFITRTALDQRDLQPIAQGNSSDAAFNRLQRARRALNDAANSVTAVAGASDSRISLLRALEGYTLIGLGENFCSGIPVSTVVDGQRQEGEPLATAQVFEQAIARYDAALAVNANDNLARVGKARALLNLGKFEEAATVARSVPRSFVHFVEHSANSTRQQNPIFALQANGRYSVSNDEGGTGTPFGTPTTDGEGVSFREPADPRVPYSAPRPGFDATIPVYSNLRYPGFGANVALATGVEAQLILAEAALRANRPAEFLSILNSLRSDVRSLMAIIAPTAEYPAGFPRTLAPLEDPGTAGGRVDLLFDERARWLYNTGHRLGDLRRLVRQYNRTQENVFPSGRYFKGGLYGNDVTLPIPFDEVNNSQYNLAGCNTKQA